MGKLHLNFLSAHMLHHLHAAFHITFEMRACYITLPTYANRFFYLCMFITLCHELQHSMYINMFV